MTEGTRPQASGASSRPREIAPGIWWLPQCLSLPLSGQITHLHVSLYLIIGDDRTLLWDTGTPQQWNAISRDLDELLGDRTLDYVVPSHPEIPHCGNVGRLMEKYPDAQLVGDVSDYPFFFPAHADRMVTYPEGSTIDLGTHRFEFCPAIIKDLPSSQWGYEASQGVLFVADGFAYSHNPPIEGEERPPHAPGECSLLVSELGGTPGPDQVVWITKAALYWTRFVKLERYRETLEALLREHPTRLVAPAHGAVIDDVEEVLWSIWGALELAYDPHGGVAAAAASYTDKDPA